MTTERSRFAGGDQAYLRDDQYRDGTNLTQRANLHAKYSTAAEPWFDWIGAKLDLIEGADVLEAGCGTGWLWTETTVPIPAGISLTLTDLSPGMVAQAQAAVEASGRFASVDARSADLQSLPLTDASYDRIAANHMLYHLPDPALGVAEMARVVKEDGAVVAATNGRRHLRELWEIRSQVFGTRRVDETAEVFNPEVGFRLFRKHFVDVRWIAYPDVLPCTEPADVIAHICSTPPAETASVDELQALRRAVDAAFLQGGGQLRVTKEVGAFVCRGPIREQS